MRWPSLVAFLGFVVPSEMIAQASPVLLRWPATSSFAMRLDVLDSTVGSGGIFTFFGVNHSVLALWPQPCDHPPCTTLAARLEVDRYTTSSDSGKTYHVTDVSRGDTAIVSLSPDGQWAPVADGSSGSAGYTVEHLLDISRLVLPQGPVAVGDRWPIETPFVRQTRPFGEIRAFFRGHAALDSVSGQRAWITLTGVDSSASRDGSMIDSIHSSIIWDLEGGGLVSAEASSLVRALPPMKPFELRTRRQVKRAAPPAIAKPAL